MSSKRSTQITLAKLIEQLVALAAEPMEPSKLSLNCKYLCYIMSQSLTLWLLCSFLCQTESNNHTGSGRASPRSRFLNKKCKRETS